MRSAAARCRRAAAAAATARGGRRTAAAAARPGGLVIFDKDGTLIDFHCMWGPWTEDVAARLQAHLPAAAPGRADFPARFFDGLGYDIERRRVRSLGPLICSPMGQLREIGAAVLRDAGMPAAEAEAALRAEWGTPDPVALARPLADLPTLFGELRAMGYAVAVATTDCRAPTEATLAHFGVLVGVGAGMLMCGNDPIPPKPDPEQLLRLCRRAGVDAGGGAVMVGDTPTDMKMGRAARCRLTVGVLGGASDAGDVAEHADCVVASIARLPALLRRLPPPAAAA